MSGRTSCWLRRVLCQVRLAGCSVKDVHVQQAAWDALCCAACVGCNARLQVCRASGAGMAPA